MTNETQNQALDAGIFGNAEEIQCGPGELPTRVYPANLPIIEQTSSSGTVRQIYLSHEQLRQIAEIYGVQA